MYRAGAGSFSPGNVPPLPASDPDCTSITATMSLYSVGYGLIFA